MSVVRKSSASSSARKASAPNQVSWGKGGLSLGASNELLTAWFLMNPVSNFS